MPEGDTVFRAAALLDRTLSGHPLVATEFRVPQHATADLSGATIETTIARGKHLLTRFDSGQSLHTHLKMEGSWKVHDLGGRWERPGHTARVVLRTATHEAVGFQLGIVELLDTADENSVVGHLGPDLLGPDWDEAEALRRLTDQPQRAIHEALLDQTNLAGIGNMYAAELCFTSGVPPRAQVKDVPDLPRLVRRARQMLRLNSTRAVQSTTGELRQGRRTWVYRQTTCLRCRTAVKIEELGDEGRERVAYYCPSCQPA